MLDILIGREDSGPYVCNTRDCGTNCRGTILESFHEARINRRRSEFRNPLRSEKITYQGGIGPHTYKPLPDYRTLKDDLLLVVDGTNAGHLSSDALPVFFFGREPGFKEGVL